MYITKKTIKGKDYYYLRKSVREGKKVKSINIAYLGKSLSEAKRKMEEIVNKKKESKDKVEGVKITYFVHGTTKDNEKGISTGQAHGELSELGIKQAKELSNQIKDKKFDVVFTSDLKRAVDSAKISFGKYKIIQDKRLREGNYGDLNQAKEEKVKYEEHIDEPFLNGESLKDVEKRISDFIDFLKKNYSGKQVAIIAHKATQLALDVLLKGKTWKQAIEEDWRKKKDWQPGWKYELTDKQKVAKEKKELTIDELATFCKRKGFVFPSSEIYGGFSGFWDFGPLGVDLFNNIKQSWWKFFVDDKENMLGIDASIISHPITWKASGHLQSFSDVAVICKKCKKATKIDKSELGKVKCECGGEFQEQGEFNLMFKTKVGALNAEDSYLRPETAQGMFMDFKLVAETSRVKLPFGIAQIGKCFRNEIAPRDFLFRSREFTIGEFEFFIHPEEKKCELLDKKHLDFELNLLDAETQKLGKQELKKTTIGKMLQQKKLEEWHGYWLAEQLMWFISLGLNIDKIKIREHKKDELSHYSSATFDIDYLYPFGSLEVAGNANRGQYDLTQHQKESKKNLEIFDEKTKKKVIPRVIEPTFGMERVFLAILSQAYEYNTERENIVLKIPSKLAPVKVAVFPLVNDEKMLKMARNVFDDLKKEFAAVYDTGGSIGRRYSRADETGVPVAITIDGQSLQDKTITLRDRDTTEQVRVKIKDLKEVLRKAIDGENISKFGKITNTRKK